MEVNPAIASREAAVLSEFMPIKLLCQSPKTKFDLWVFWRQEEEEESTNSVFSIQNHIRTVLCSLKDSTYLNYLVQFWAPTTTRSLLTISQQPFAFTVRLNNDIDEHHIRYRNRCGGYTVSDGDGVVGRVFQNQLPEFSPDLRDYSLEEHPLRDLALSCGIIQTCAFPVYEPSRQSESCVGVLEFLFSSNTSLFYSSNIDWVFSELEAAGLVIIDTQKIQEQIPECIHEEADKIRGALKEDCKAHDLSIARIWFRCRHSHSSRSYSESNDCGRGDFVVSVPELFTYDCPSLLARVGQGLIGNAFLSSKPYLCTDVTQLNVSQYPMVHSARNSGIPGCILICLQRLATGNRDYVLEFYLSRRATYGVSFNKCLSSVLAILKLRLTGFEAVVVDPERGLFVEVDKFSINSVFESLKKPPTSSIEIEPGALQNEGEVLQVDAPGHHLLTEEFAKSGGDFVGLEQRQKAVVEEEKHLEKKSKAAHDKKECSCSYETLKQHFGRKLEDAAESLGVSRSTVKRWCRDNNISRWPFPKRSKVTSLAPIPEQINEPIKPNSDLISKDLYSSVALTDLAPKRDMDTVTLTVKASYKNDIIKFQLSFSSRMIDLVKKVILRLKLSEGTFAIKYLDDEGDYILVACDVDLQDCINSFKTLEQTTIKMMIEPLL